MRERLSRAASRGPQSAPVAAGLLQRKCACGAHGSDGHMCADCARKRRLAEVGSGAHGAASADGLNVLRSPGQALDAGTRAFMEHRFGHDFSRVRVHTDLRAAESAREVHALAYTLGRHIVFGGDQYAPKTDGGRQLLAHELGHTLQQGMAEWAPGLARRVGPGDSLHEREAESGARQILGTRALNHFSPASPGVQRAGPEGGATGSPGAPARPAMREVIAIRLGHEEAGGLGRFDTLLYHDCAMKVQFRMNFNFLGPWPDEGEKRSWQRRFITSVEEAWSNRFDLEATGTCASPCSRVRPFVAVYAPHSSPHVNVDVTYTTTDITSTAGGGVAHLDSRDLTPVKKGPLTEEKRRTAGVRPMVPAVHEFGHLVGRPDLYRAGGTCAPGYPLAGIMCFGNQVLAQDYGPFANAAHQMTRCTYSVVPRAAGGSPTGTGSRT